ncbi:MAG: SCP2 sterol-binding domain-containing protein [Rhodospirillaceae bacterium]|nr:SCP2 sterol-binding domain-containing protein [Rhodospirillaceae bacterium]
METEALIEEMRRRAGQNVKLGYKVKFLVEDDIIFWDGTEHPPTIGSEDLGDANTTIRISPENLQKLLHGQLDPTLAYMTGKLKVEGSMGVALKLTSMFGD